MTGQLNAMQCGRAPSFLRELEGQEAGAEGGSRWGRQGGATCLERLTPIIPSSSSCWKTQL